MKTFKIDRNNALFLFVDIQDKLLKSVFNRESLEKNARVLSSLSHITGIPSLITLQYPQGLGGMNEFIREPIQDAKEIGKVHFSSMENEEIREAIQSFGRRQIILCGIETHICVFQTARGLIDAGYEVFVVKDAVGSRKEDNTINGIQLMDEMGCVVTNTETVLFDIAGLAGTEEFKQLQNLIK